MGLLLVEDSASHVVVQAGRSRLTFTASAGDHGGSHFAFNIPPGLFARAASWLKARLALLREDGAETFHSEEWNADMLYFLDAERNILEFIARHDLNTAPVGTFGPSALLDVSEVGPPVWDMPVSAGVLRETLALKTFRSASSTFTPIGDQRGQFIVVPVGRPWFPTQVGAASRSWWGAGRQAASACRDCRTPCSARHPLTLHVKARRHSAPDRRPRP